DLHLEEVTEDVAVGSSVLIRQAGHSTMEHHRRHGPRFPVARRTHAHQDAAKTGEDQLIDETAAVVANVDDHALFADLREPLPDKLIQPGPAHVGNIDVSHPTIGGGVHFLAIVLDPVAHAQQAFVINWFPLTGGGA